MEIRLEGRTAIVTGAGSGIGRAIALRFAEAGARVIVNDRQESGAQTARAIAEAGGQARFVQADLREEGQVRELVEAAEREWGGLHVLVNNAGVRGSANVVTATDDDWQTIMDTNLKGAWYACKHAIPAMMRAGGGSIVNISSTHVMRTQPDHFPYHAAKGGMQSMTLGIAVDYGPHGIRANNLCPGFILTPMAEQFFRTFPDPAGKEAAMLSAHPVGRFGTPDDVAHAALFLASDEAGFISGASIVVDGGRSAYQKSD